MKKSILIFTIACLTNSYGNFAQGMADAIRQGEIDALRENANAVLEEQRKQNNMIRIKKEYLNKMILKLLKYERLVQEIAKK
jgi:ABC-type amino acid transport substrate-binding protein